MPHPMSSSINSRYVILQKCNILSIFIRIAHQTLPYYSLSSSWCEEIFSSHIQQSRMNEKVYPTHFTLLLPIFSYQLPLTSFTWFPYSILLHAHLVHFTFSYRSFIFSSSCHSALLHSPPHSLHSFPFCLTQQIFIELSSFTRWEFVESNTSEWAGLVK